MTNRDQQLLFTALGFLAVTMQEGTVKNGGSDRVLGFAALLEDYCRIQVPESFATTFDEEEAMEQDRFIALYKARIQSKGAADLPEGRNALIRLYSRLVQRSMAHASDEDLSAMIRLMLDAEISKQEAAA